MPTQNILYTLRRSVYASANQLKCGVLVSPEGARNTSVKMEAGNAVIALENNEFAGFCYIEVWGRQIRGPLRFDVSPDHRGKGLAKQIKKKVFDLSKEKFPNAKIFGITTGKAVMRINYELGYQPVDFSQLTDDPDFWKGCQTCKNYDVLTRTERTMCLCTGMLYDPRQ